MIAKLIRKLIKLDENDAKVKQLQDQAKSEIDSAVLVLQKAGTLQRTMVKKTTTFYIGKAMGVIE